MNKIFFLFFISTAAFSKSSLILSPKRIDFGSITQGEIMTHDITLSNEYDKEIKINGIYESCGCLFVREETMVIGPKSSKKFTVKFDSSLFKGKQLKYIDVLTSEVRSNIHRVSIKADIKQNYEISPPVLVLDKDEMKGVKPIRVKINNKRQNKVEITDLEYNKEIFEIRSQSKDRLEFRIKSGSLPRNFSGHIKIHTNDSHLKEFTVPVRIREEHVQVSAEFVDFGTVEGKYSRRKELKIDFDRDVDIKDVKVKMTDPIDFKYDIRKYKKNEKRIRMYVKNTAGHKGNFKCFVDITTSDEEFSSIKIPCFGYFE